MYSQFYSLISLIKLNSTISSSYINSSKQVLKIIRKLFFSLVYLYKRSAKLAACDTLKYKKINHINPKHFLLQTLHGESEEDGQNNTMTLYTLQQVFTLLFYSNFAVNFLLYCVTGQNFRKAVVSMFVPPKGPRRNAGPMCGSRLNNSMSMKRQGSPSIKINHADKQTEEHYV